MPTYILTIEEVNPANASDDTEHYRRRVVLEDTQPIIDALDAALKAIPKPKEPRRQRSDAGKPRATT